MKLSPTMHKAVDLANEGGGKLVYMRGGFWVKPGTPSLGGWPTERLPDGPWIGSSTVNALIKRGVLKITAKGWKGFPSEVTITERIGP